MSTLEPVEKLPNNAIEFIATHPDGTIHKWVEYPSIEAVGRQEHRKMNPKMINCPKCHKRGRVNGYNNYKDGTFNYVVVHEKIDGKWGRGKNTTSRRRRCYIYNKTQRDSILKKLGRLIA